MRFVAIWTVLSLAASCAVALGGNNPVPNPGFEESKDGKPNGWSVSGQPKGFDWSASVAEHHSGNASLMLKLASTEAKDAHIEVISDPFPVTGGKLQRYVGWYKSTGWSGKGNIYSQTLIQFYDEAHKNISLRDGTQMDIPYASTEAWRFAEMVVPAPENAREARIIVRVHVYDASKEKTPALYVDDLLVQSYDVPSTPKEARKWMYPARSYGVNVPTERIPESQVGGAMHARVGQDPTGGLISGPLIADQGPGMYRVTYRMMVADNTKPEQVCTIYIASGGVLNTHSMRSRTILSTDFKQANHFEEFSMDFLRPPWDGMQYLCTWWGKVDLWLDAFTVTEVKHLPDRQLIAFYGEAPGGEVKPDAQGGLFVLRGPFFPLYRLDEVASALGTKVTRVAHIATPGGNSVLNPPFPSDPAELSGLRAVVMADVDAESLGFQGRNSLRIFVEAGGVLVVLGGWVSYGESKMEDTFIEGMLPVTNSGAFDREKCEPPCALAPSADWSAGKSLPWSDRPCVLWTHRLAAKSDAKVLVTAGGPDKSGFLITRDYGKGRVIACAGTVLGIAPPGVKPFWEWDGWPRLLATAISR